MNPPPQPETPQRRSETPSEGSKATRHIDASDLHIARQETHLPTDHTTSAPATRVLDSESIRDTEQDAGQDAGSELSESTKGKGRGRRTRLAGFALLLVALGLVSLASWWVLQSRSPVSGSADPIPQNAVEIINSATPIPERNSPLTVRDDFTTIPFAPDSEKWAPPVKEAYQALREGRYPSAISLFSSLIGGSNITEAHDALWGLAGAYEAAGQNNLAVRTYSLFSYIRDDPRAAQAYFRIGEIQRKEGLYEDALSAYQQYIAHSGAARQLAMLRAAGLRGSTPEGITAYTTLINQKPLDIDMRDALSNLASLYDVLDKHDDAIATYKQLAALQATQSRPLLDISQGEPPEERMAAQQKAQGDLKGARQTLLNYVNNPNGTPYGRFSSLDDLIRIDGNTVLSGTVSPTLAAALAYDAGYYSRAIDYMDAARSTMTDPTERAKAALLTGKAYAASGDYADAFNWYTATVQTYPTSAEAPEALRRAGDALREQSSWDEALGAYNQAVAQYGTTAEADTARLNGAVLAYRLEQRDVSLGLLTPLLTSTSVTTTVKSQAYFWAGKVQKAAGQSGWQNTLSQVGKISPGSYFSLRAQSIIEGEPSGGPVMLTYTQSKVLTGTLGVSYSGESAQRAELYKWAAGLPGAKASEEITDTITPRLAADPEVRRAVALLRLGPSSDSYVAFRLLGDRLSKEGDAQGLAQIVTYLRYNADTRTAMRVAEMLGSMDKGGDPSKWPALLLKTLYPTPYSQVVLDEAHLRGIDPLVMYALIRQESEFIPDAQSGADARGLTQVVPSTGQGIADQIGDSAYTNNSLYIPYISIRYGTYYLASNLPQFDNKLLPTLAAYNGGPGNAARWLEGSALFDPDLYAERIDLYETGDYIERVYLNYGFYRQLYTGEQSR